MRIAPIYLNSVWLILLSLTLLWSKASQGQDMTPDAEKPLIIIKTNPIAPLINFYSEAGLEYGLDQRHSLSAFVGYVGAGLLPRPIGAISNDILRDGETIRRRFEKSARGPFITASYRNYLSKGEGLSEGYEQAALEGVYIEGQLRLGYLSVEERATTYNFSGPDDIRYQRLDAIHSALTVGLGSQLISGKVALDIDFSGGVGYSSDEELILTYFSPVLGNSRWSTQWNLRCRIGFCNRLNTAQK